MHQPDCLAVLLEKEGLEFCSSSGTFVKKPTASSVYVLHTKSTSVQLADRVFVPVAYTLTDKEKGKITGSSKGSYLCRDPHAKENPLQFIVKHKVNLAKNRGQAIKEACKVDKFYESFVTNRTGLQIDYVLVLDFQEAKIDTKAVLAEIHTVLRGQGKIKFRLLSHNGKEPVLSAVQTAQDASNAFSAGQSAITAFAQRVDPFANLAAEAARSSSQSAKGSSQAKPKMPKKPAAKKPIVKAPAVTLDNFFIKALVNEMPPAAPVEVVELAEDDNADVSLPSTQLVHQEPVVISAPLEVMIHGHSQSLLDEGPSEESHRGDKRSSSPSLPTHVDVLPRPNKEIKKARIDHDDLSDLTEPEDEDVEIDPAFFDYYEAFKTRVRKSMDYIANDHIYKAFVNDSLVSKRIAARREFLPSELQRLETFFRQELSQLRALSLNLVKLKPHTEVGRLQRDIKTQIEQSEKSLRKLHQIQKDYLFGQSVAPFADKYLTRNKNEILLAFQQCLPQVSAEGLATWYQENDFAVLSSIADCCFQNNVAVLNPSANNYIPSIARYLAFYLIMIHPEGKSLISSVKESVEIPMSVMQMIQTYVGGNLKDADKGPVLDSLVDAYSDLSQQRLPDCRTLALKKHLSALNVLQNGSQLISMQV